MNINTLPIWQRTWIALGSMTVAWIIKIGVAAVVLNASFTSAQSQQPPPPPVATFKSAVELVRVAAFVRDHKGRFVENLTAKDFEVLDGTEPRPIVDFRRESEGVSVAVLFDVSGSMESRLVDAREAGAHVLAWLDPSRDEAAVYTFDTELVEVVPFTMGLKTLPSSMSKVVAFGATSLHDAIAETAKRSANRDRRRSAVVVLTDGEDTASRLKPSEVSAIASAIDVPVYIFGIVPSIDNPSEDRSTILPGQSKLTGALDDLSVWTGGRVFIASTPAQRSLAARQLVEELRHQYFIAFESSGKPGWHPLVVRARDKDLTVRARNGYIAGQSRPHSF
jgi:Ca-activated chloride channel homolog